jgi:hypothetical protein
MIAYFIECENWDKNKYLCVCDLCCDKCHELLFWLPVCCKFECIVVSYDWDRLQILRVLNLESVQMYKWSKREQFSLVVEWTTFNSVDFIAFKEFFGGNVDPLTISTNISSRKLCVFMFSFKNVQSEEMKEVFLSIWCRLLYLRKRASFLHANKTPRGAHENL